MLDPARRLTMTADELAAHWSLTPRRLRELRDEGIAVECSGAYDVVESDSRLIRKLRSHEETRRQKAALLVRQTQRQEIRLRADIRELITRAEAQAACLAWWEAAWNAATGAVSRLYYTLPVSDIARLRICSSLYADIRGELVLHRDRIPDAFMAPAMPHTLDRHLELLGIGGSEPAADENNDP